MPKYKVVLDHGESHTVDADVVTIDTHYYRFDKKKGGLATPELVAVFPARKVCEVIKVETN